MKKTIVTIALIIAVLIIVLLCWNLFFGADGILQSAWNGVADAVNGMWQSITGGDGTLMPQWVEGSTLADVLGAGGGGDPVPGP